VPINKGESMAKRKLKTPEDIIEAIREKQSEIDDLIYDLENKVSDISSAEDEDEDIEETDEE
jgi:peptidoglycan hydrolase CwlO-like protein